MWIRLKLITIDVSKTHSSHSLFTSAIYTVCLKVLYEVNFLTKLFHVLGLKSDSFLIERQMYIRFLLLQNELYR